MMDHTRMGEPLPFRLTLRTTVGALALSVGCLSTVLAQDDPPPLAIEHTPAPCMDTDTFPLITARAASPEAARFTRGLVVRFKAESDAGYYETSFSGPEGDRFRAVLPRPMPEASRIAYYLATGDPERRSPEYLVSVLAGGCPGAEQAPPSLTSDIRIRRTEAAQNAMPLYFETDGLQSGRAISGTTIGLVAGAAGGAAIAAIALGDDNPPNTGGPDPPTNPPALRACFTPDPIPDISSGNTVLFGAACTSPETVTSFQWDFGDGGTGTGSSVEHLFIPGGTYTVTLTVSDGQRMDSTSRLVRVLATPIACFVTTPDPPRITADQSIQFNGECSVGDRDGGAAAITRYEWDFGDGRPGAEGVFLSRQFDPDVYGVTLTVTNQDGRQASKTQFVVVEAVGTTLTNGRERHARLPFVATWETESRSARQSARISLNGAELATASPNAPVSASLTAAGSDNTVEVRFVGTTGAGRFTFDFGNPRSPGVEGLRVESGHVIARSERRIVFQLSEEAGPVLRFRFGVTGRSQ